MVERLRVAIEKARSSREAAVPNTGDAARGQTAAPHGAPSAEHMPDADKGELWQQLREIQLDSDVLTRERIISLDRTDRAHFAFDALRTRLLTILRDNGWSRVAVTSPTKGCGKTTVAANLAFSLARQPETTTMLIDLDLRMPQLANRLGQNEDFRIRPFLSGRVSGAEYLRRYGDNLAFALNTTPDRNSAELVQSRQAAEAIAAVSAEYRPDVMLFDTPPMLTCDDVLGFLPNVDGVLLVIGGGQSKAASVEECEQLIEAHSNLLGVVLNKGEGSDSDDAYYGYSYGDG